MTILTGTFIVSYRVFEILDSEADGTNDESPAISAPPTPVVTSVPFTKKHASDNSIEFRNVSFAYRSRPDVFILTNFNVEILPNKITVFVGKSGSGKSTILSLLSGLFQPTGGNIRYCDKVIAQSKHAAAGVSATSAFSPVPSADGSVTPGLPVAVVEEGWCFNNVGVVEQSSSPLLSGTIAENIEYGKVGCCYLFLDSLVICHCRWEPARKKLSARPRQPQRTSSSRPYLRATRQRWEWEDAC